MAQDDEVGEHSISSGGDYCYISKQCNPGRIAKSLLVGSAPKPLKTRACALWLCRIPASSDSLAAPKPSKKKSPCASYAAANSV